MRRAILFVVLLAILVGLIVCLVKLKGDERENQTPVAGATAVPAAGDTPTAAPAQPTAAPTPSPTQQPLPSADPVPVSGDATPTPAPTEEPGEAAELTVYLEGGAKLVPARLLEYTLPGEPVLRFSLVSPVQGQYDDGVWTFPLEPQGEGDADLPVWLAFRRVSGTTAGELLPDFMSGYLRFTEIEFSGASALGDLKMDETVTAAGEGLLMRAWLLDVPQGVFAAVLCCALDRTEPDMHYLEAMLETLTLTVEK